MDQEKEKKQTAQEEGKQDKAEEAAKIDQPADKEQQPKDQALEKPSGDQVQESQDPFGAQELKLPADHPTRVLSTLSHEERKLFLSMAGLSTFVKSTGRLFWTNFLLGLARGIGFVIGMSIIGAVCVAVWNEFLSVTGIGQFIARLIEEINKNTPAP